MEEKTAVRKSYKKMPRKKVCAFCQEKVTEIDYKDINRLKKFVTEGGKIVPRRMSGTCAAHREFSLPRSSARESRPFSPSRASNRTENSAKVKLIPCFRKFESRGFFINE